MLQLEEPLISWLILVARCCLAAVFLVSGIHKARYYDKALAEFRGAGVPVVGLFLPLTIALHLLASAGLVSGIYAREAALALALFTIVATLKVHCFWRMVGAERLNRSRVAMAHLAVVGGLILLAAVGPGSLTL